MLATARPERSLLSLSPMCRHRVRARSCDRASRPPVASYGLLLLAALALVGCPGKANLARYDGATKKKDISLTPVPDGGGWPDAKRVDGGAGKKDLGKVADATLTSTVGGACPCQSPLLCVLAACRQPCTQVICNGATNCPAGETCVNTAAKIPVCVPGVATNAACSGQAPCAVGNMCLTTDPTVPTGKCFATCPAAGQPCGTASTCAAIKDSACAFCP